MSLSPHDAAPHCGADILDIFSPATRAWMASTYPAPTEAQIGAWRAIDAGQDGVLVIAPTGSGKTLAAFLWSIDRIAASPTPSKNERLRVLYVSPLKALAADVERNLRQPLHGIREMALQRGLTPPEIRVALRTGDTPADERRRLASRPPDILITTPESLYLVLTSAARDSLRHVDTVIVDEVHALVGNKRGVHLALSLERLDALLCSGSGGHGRTARRIGLSATVSPIDEVARFLGGHAPDGSARPVGVVQPASDKRIEVTVEVPVDDVGDRTSSSVSESDERTSIWQGIAIRIVELVEAHRTTIVFANSRRVAERLCARLNELAGHEIARAHHGSVSLEERRHIEHALKNGTLPAVVATSSLELGIDMAAIDLVLQVEAPPSVASGLQRVGRAGHQVGAVSHGTIFPKWRGDLVECAVVVERMRDRAIERVRFPTNALDVLSQQIVAMVAMDDWSVDALTDRIRRAAPYRSLPSSALHRVLDMLSGLYPSDDFAELRPRLIWDRLEDRLSARHEAQRLAVTCGGTIPDRGLYGVYLAGAPAASDTPAPRSGKRVGELDEEMVYESRRGDVFVLGASSWRIEDITHDRVLVTPAPGEAGKLPFWHGDTVGRPVELGRSHGRFLREIAFATPEEARTRLHGAGLDARAAENLLRYVADQRQATGALPDDRTVVVERFRDPLGDWRLCVHTPFGARVHAPWALAMVARIRARTGVEVQSMHSDDGIVIRLPEADRTLPEAYVVFSPQEIETIVTQEVSSSALFASRFRECAARALLLPRRRPGQRTPLWQQRQKSANLLTVAAGYPSFPIALETMRECLQDVFDLPALRDILADIESHRLTLVQVETDRPSPFANALLFEYVGAFIYDGDAPLAERRAQALALDTSLLAELLGPAELRDLIDADTLAETEAVLQRLAPQRHLRSEDDVHDALRVVGDLSEKELEARGATTEWLDTLIERRRIARVQMAGQIRYIALEDAARYRDALGVELPLGIAPAFLTPPKDALGDLVGRFARTHGPFTAAEVCLRYGLPLTDVTAALARLESAGRVTRGEFRPLQGAPHADPEWCDVEVLRSLRRRSLGRLRKAIEPVSPQAFARFLPQWQGVGSGWRAPDAVLRTVERLQGVAIPASALETLVLPARVEGYGAWMLDELCASGDVLWVGDGASGSDDGWIRLYLADGVGLLRPPPTDFPTTELAQRVLDTLDHGGALFFRQIADRLGTRTPLLDSQLLTVLWELVWAGRVTNDTLAPLRAMLGSASLQPARAARRPRRGPSLPSRMGPPGGAGRWTLVPRDAAQPTARATALAEQLLTRHGVVTRGAVMAEEVAGGFAAMYDVMSAFEAVGKCRRGYFVDGLGAAQFAAPGAVERLRSNGRDSTHVLAATDPANPYGAALGWPASRDDGHRPTRKTGALVVLHDGNLVLYVERGGRTLLSFTDDSATLESAARALAHTVTSGALGRIAIERTDAQDIFGTPIARILQSAGFRETHRGLVLERLHYDASH